jgi:tRNA-dihydrouridine synthase C
MLAPMEGVTDHPMREILTGLGGYSRCVTEFLRVTDHEYPKRVFTRICPELATGGVTRSGTPVYVQLLGSHAIRALK